MKRKSNSATWMADAASNDGAEIQWISNNTFIATKNNISLVFLETRCLDTHQAWALARHKGAAKKLLIQNGTPVPNGVVCSSVDEVKKFREELNKSIVVKPVVGTKGKGISVNVETELEVEKACLRAGIDKNSVLAEEMVSGTEYRVMVLGGRSIAAIYKDPANVVGDGNSTVKKLILEKNQQRKFNPNLAIYRIKVDDYIIDNLEKQGLNIHSIIPEGQKVYLRREGNLSAGGESVDVTDELPSFVYESCVRAANSFPGLELAGVDIFYDKDAGSCNVIEVNTNPGCGGHLFPHIGKPRNVTGAIWRYSYEQAEASEIVRSKAGFNELV